MKYVLLLLFAGLLYAPLCAQAPDQLTHERESKHYGQMGLESEAEWDAFHRATNIPAINYGRSGCNLNKQVYGWHPYWIGSAYNNYDWDNLSTLSYFSYEVNPSTGNYNSIHAWKTTNSITQAQANGVRVELCVTNFGGTNNTTFLTNPTAQQTLIDSLIALVAYRNADGVNIDFEGVPGAQRNNFTAFLQNLSNQLKAARPGASLSMAIFAVDWNNVFDIPNLVGYVDQFIIMGYDYYYSGSSDAGPTAPLYSGSLWWSYNLKRTVLYYLNEGVPSNQLLLGLPYFGMEWNTASNTYPSTNTGYISSRTFAYAKNNYAGTYPRTFDEHSQSTAYIFQSGGLWRQSWIDDEESLGEKMDLVLHHDLGGMGIWALGYDNGRTELWNAIEERFSDCAQPYCSDTLYDTGGPLGNYRNNEDYTFTVQSPAGQAVTATFLSFDLESNFDYLYVYDGTSTAAPLLGQFDGNIPPGPFTSSGDALTFRFDSDGATLASGWEMAWACEGPSVYADTIRLDRNDSAYIDCGQPYHVFYDSDANAGDYAANEDHTMTFCASDNSRSVRLSFNMLTAPVQLDVKSTVQGNDYLSVWDGPDRNANLVARYTGSTDKYPQPGTIISSGQCLTARFESDNFLNGIGWEGTLRCVTRPSDLGTLTASSAAPLNFSDLGGASNYGNNERYRVSYCPDASAQANNEVIWADFGPVEIEQNYDYLHVYDGPDVNSRLIGTFTGNDTSWNDLQVIKATQGNTSGCLTFAFTSDGATTASGWSANIGSGAPRRPYGSDSCGTATLINEAGVAYAGSTTLAKGLPGNPDPPLNISLASLPECSGSNTITRLENTIWYTFSTPSTICPSSQIDLQLENIACQNSIPAGNGAQLMIYESLSCQSGSAWGQPIYCSDKLLQSFPVNIAGLLQPSQTYYVLIDGFAGQHCNLDLILTGDINGCILPIELLEFNAQLQDEVVALDWETAAEQNNSGFFVQRGIQVDGSLDFEDIGFVEATADPDGTGQYAFADPHYRRGRTNFYRLRQLDLDGSSHFHKVVAVKDGHTGVELFPNPSSGRVTLRFATGGGEALQMGIYDVQGRQVWTQSWADGQAPAELTLDLSDQEKGMYIYRLTWGEEQVVGKLVLE